MIRLHWLAAVVLGAVAPFPAFGENSGAVDAEFTATFVTRIIDTPQGPMAVCGAPLPEDAGWLADAGFDVGPIGGIAGGFENAAAPAVPSTVPGPGGGAVLVVSGAMILRRRSR